MSKNDLDERRSKLTGRLVTRLASAYDRRLSEGKTSKNEMPTSQKLLLIQLELKGSRVSTLADRVGVSKQAVSRMSQVLEEKGFVKRVNDDLDGRATWVYFTERGRRLVQNTVEAFEKIEQEMIQELGAKDAEKLNRLLAKWAAYLDPDSF